MGTETRGFASMSKGKQRRIASQGGRTAHAQGVAHEWSQEEARIAGQKGGLASAERRKRFRQDQLSQSVEPGIIADSSRPVPRFPRPVTARPRPGSQ
jgi:hypothetical protein